MCSVLNKHVRKNYEFLPETNKIKALTSIQIGLLECVHSSYILHLLGTQNEIFLLNSHDNTT